ncbi:unnamed protein product [Prunus brigantina]
MTPNSKVLMLGPNGCCQILVYFQLQLPLLDKLDDDLEYLIVLKLRVFHLERPNLGLKEIAQEYKLNWDSSNTEAGSSILNLGFF